MRADQVAVELGVDYEFEWRARAYCRFIGPRLFYAPETKRLESDTHARAVREAKRVCQRCEVESSCLAWAVAHPKEVGVWGGTTTEERDTLRRRCRRLRVRSESSYASDDESLQAV